MMPGPRNFRARPVFCHRGSSRRLGVPISLHTVTTTLRPRRLTIALLAGAALAVPAPAAHALDTVPGQVVVGYTAGPVGTAAAAAAATTPAQPAVLQVADVRTTLRRLRATPGVRYAVRNVIAHASAVGVTPTGYVPNDPGRAGIAGGWAQQQWNFAGDYGVQAPRAWLNALNAGAAGGRGVVVAVLDTGVAYANRSPYRRSPDFTAKQFVRGWDFVDRDPFPFDRNGHGTHVAGTIAEATDNGVALTGLAYGARIMPVRVLDDAGAGDAVNIAAGIRFAAARGAKVLNLSLEFDTDVVAADIPELIDAIRYARRKGALVVAATGNEGATRIAYPARAQGVLSVGATTEHGCLSAYSNDGSGIDLVAPGGGEDAVLPDDARCSADPTGRSIFQETLLDTGTLRQFGIPSNYEGTSMAVPHVSATAALVIATKAIGPAPTPTQLEQHLKTTARDLGGQGYDTRYGWGLVDAAAATATSSG